MRAFIHSFVLCAVLAISSIIATAQTPGQAVPSPTVDSTVGGQMKDERYRIGFEDRLDIQVFRHPELSHRVSVNPNGTINLFRLNHPINAVCKTERELANDIADAYRKDYLRNPEVNVVAIEQRSRAFGVIGAVEKPGKYLIGRRVRLLELLSEAGGPSKDAGSRVIVARLGSTSHCRTADDVPAPAGDDVAVLGYKLKDILEAKENVIMNPGDVLAVLKADVIFVYGNVNKQGQIEIKEPLTLTQALASAEGLKAASDKGKIRVLRQKPNSTEREEFIYDLDDINSRKVPDPFLEPSDIVAVNVDKTKEVFNSIGRAMTQGLPGLFYRVP